MVAYKRHKPTFHTLIGAVARRIYGAWSKAPRGEEYADRMAELIQKSRMDLVWGAAKKKKELARNVEPPKLPGMVLFEDPRGFEYVALECPGHGTRFVGNNYKRDATRHSKSSQHTLKYPKAQDGIDG